MKVLTAALVIVMSGIVGWTPPTEPIREYELIGHRGLGKSNPVEPENSTQALVSALRHGAAAVELDVQLSSDGEVVLAHDEVVDRITNGTGCVINKTARELLSLRLRDGSGRIHPDQGVATLREALQAIRAVGHPGFIADIHVKVYDGIHGDIGHRRACPPTPFPELASRVVEIVRSEGMVDSVLITSFDLRVLRAIRRAEPRLRLGLLSLVSTRMALARARRAGVDTVVASNVTVDSSDVRVAHALGMKLFVWFPFSESGRADRFAARYADGIISDHPTALIRRQPRE